MTTNSTPDHAPRISRRTLVAGAGIGAGTAFLTGLAALPARADGTSDPGTAELLDRWRTMLTGGDGLDLADPQIATAAARIDRTAAGYLTTLVTGSDRTALWSDLADPTRSTNVTSSFTRLARITRAWATRGTQQYGDADVLAAVLAGLDWMYENRYAPTLTRFDNDWDWEIGSPIQLNDTLVLLGPAAGEERRARLTAAVDHYTPDPNLWRVNRQIATGANRVWVCTVVAVRALLDGDGAALTEVRDALSDVRGHGANSVLAHQDAPGHDTGTGEGFYSDGSFLQHWKHPYNGGYGKELLATLSALLSLLADSPWQVTDPDRDNVFAWVSEAFDPLLFRGDLMAAVCGREIARPSKQGHAAADRVIEATLRLIGAAEAGATRDRLTGLVRRWLTTDTYRDYLKTADLSSVLLAKQVLGGPVPAAPAPVLHRQYPRMDKVVHHRPGFGFAVSAYSTRIYNYESIQNENLHGWHLSDGMTLLYDDDLGHYSEDYWPTVDAYRLPGTTVERRTLADAQDQRTEGRGDWVGGAALPGTTLGAYGMDLRGLGESNLRAWKSWFFVDDAVLCVGSGIGGDQVETIVENRKLRDVDAVLTLDGVAVPGSPGLRNDVHWAHLAGTGGYVFADPVALTGLREQRTATWREINLKYGTDTVVTRPYLTLWLDHSATEGTGATNYAWTQLPGADAATTAAWSADPPVEVIAAKATVHAVRRSADRMLAANFWAAGSVAEVSVDGPASVVLAPSGRECRIAVSDPTQLRDRVVVDLQGPRRTVVSADPGVAVEPLRGGVRITATTAGLAGRTLALTVR